MANTLFEYYQGKGQALPSISERSGLFASQGLGSASEYRGTAQQNTALLAKLQGGGGTPAQAVASPTQPASQLSSPEQVTDYLNAYQNTIFSGRTAPETRMPGKEDINPETGKAYAVNPTTGQWDDNYWANVVEPRLKSQTGGGGGPGGLPTFEQVQSQLKPAGERPALISRAAERERLRTEYKVADLETKLTDLKAQEDEAYAQLRTNVAAERGKPVAMNIIEGRISEQQRTAQENLDFIGRQKARVVDELQVKYSIINQYVQDKGLDYTDAVNEYDKEFSQNLQIAELVRGLRRDQLDEQEMIRDNAKANLQMYVSAIQGGNLDYASMSGDQKVMISKLEAQAGLPIGFVSGLQMSAKDRLLNVNEKTGEALIVGSDGKFKVVQTGMRPTPKEETQSDKELKAKKAAFTDMGKTLQELGGDDGLVSPQEWKEARSAWVREGFSGKDFDEAFRGQHVDEDDPTKYGLE